MSVDLEFTDTNHGQARAWSEAMTNLITQVSRQAAWHTAAENLVKAYSWIPDSPAGQAMKELQAASSSLKRGLASRGTVGFLGDAVHEQLRTTSAHLHGLATEIPRTVIANSVFAEVSDAALRLSNLQTKQAMKALPTIDLAALQDVISDIGDVFAANTWNLPIDEVLPDPTELLWANAPAIHAQPRARIVTPASPSLQNLRGLLRQTLDRATIEPEAAPRPSAHAVPLTIPSDPPLSDGPTQVASTDLGNELESGASALDPWEFLVNLALRLPEDIINAASALGPNGLIVVTDRDAIECVASHVQGALIAVSGFAVLDGLLKVVELIMLLRVLNNMRR